MEPGLTVQSWREPCCHAGLAALLILLVALVSGAALRPPSARAATRDERVKTSLLALQCAVEKNGSARMYVYPHPDSVSPTARRPP